MYTATVEISGDELTVDLRDNPDQDAGPNNLSRDGAVIAAQIVLMNLVDPHGSANAGHYRPLTVLTRPGSVFDASPPAACGIYYEVRMRARPPSGDEAVRTPRLREGGVCEVRHNMRLDIVRH